MKLILVFFLFLTNTSLFYSQNKYKDILNNRIEVSKFVFDEVLDENTFNSSLVTRKIFKGQNIVIYSIKTYSTHASLNIGVFYKKKVKLFCVEEEKDIKKFLSFLTEINVSKYNLRLIEDKIRTIPYYKDDNIISPKY
jgi:hypothetical protein